MSTVPTQAPTKPTNTNSSKPGVVGVPTTPVAPVDTTPSAVVTTQGVPTPIPDTTTKATTPAPVVTTKAPVVTTKAPVVTTKAPVVTTKLPVVTTPAPVVTTDGGIPTPLPTNISTDNKTAESILPSITFNNPPSDRPGKLCITFDCRFNSVEVIFLLAKFNFGGCFSQSDDTLLHLHTITIEPRLTSCRDMTYFVLQRR